MIAKLKGVIDALYSNSVILDVNGVGYEIFCSSNTLRHIGNIGETVNLLIETHVREDHIHLFGFSQQAEKDAFRIITKVSGVGVKMALAILSSLSPKDLALAISAQDKVCFTSVSGVGQKLASRLVTELKDKFSYPIEENADSTISSINTNDNITDAVAALVGLGFSRGDAFRVVTKIAAQNDNINIDGLIKQGLKELGS